MGNVNWLSIPGFPVDIQPNEIVKLPFILLLSLQITQIQEEGRDISSLPSLIQIGGHTVFMLGLIAVVCGDMGMCVIYMMIFVFMAWASGVKLRWFLLVGGGPAGRGSHSVALCPARDQPMDRLPDYALPGGLGPRPGPVRKGLSTEPLYPGPLVRVNSSVRAISRASRPTPPTAMPSPSGTTTSSSLCAVRNWGWQAVCSCY